jgi:hypothetical protein
MDSAGDDDLVRRVPGAQMPVGARGTRPETPARRNGAGHDGARPNGAEQNGAGHDGAEHDRAGSDPAEQDAAAARSLVEDFEAGVQRALQHSGDRGTAGPAETDEEDAR